ncbi:6-phosphogluconolactonase [Sulfurospirillum sp. 1612]|uniref:6-phosphogluconolactonase n=1 Tax=Sulfurospirillum sp. 1612 TaxID=3094835 RepID=UPI002F9437B7
MSNIIHKYDNQAMLREDLSLDIATNLSEAINQKGKATLMVSGGNTPKALFESLSNINIPWGRVSIGLCDERWVNPTDDASNEKLVKTHLLQHKASKANFIGMYQDMPIAEATDICSQKVKTHLMPFDVIILGMGDDGHTASLFPHNKKLEFAYTQELENPCIAIEPTTAPHMRMSLTKAAILSARHIYLHFEGKEKTAIFHKALEHHDEFAMPIRIILNPNTKDIKVYYHE